MIGKISLIGAGLGDPELLTVKGVRKIKEADVIVYDRLINPAILNLCKKDCEKIYVGKNPTFHPVPQDQIDTILIEKAQEGNQIVRLKSGDPYVFGRGGEEGAHLKAAGIEFEIIPGITSAIGGLGYAGIPITHRDFASSFHVYTGHLKSENNQLDWATIAKTEGTLVFLMGMSELETITQQLILFGKEAATPAAIIQWASRKRQKTVTGTLATIYEKASIAELQPPSLIVIGEVVTLREQLNFFENRPLFNTSITVPYTEKKGMASQLTDLGAELIELPKPQKKIYSHELVFSELKKVVFTDKLSIEMFIQEMNRQGIDWRNLPQLAIFSVGHHTKLALAARGIQPDNSYLTLAEFIEVQTEVSDELCFLGNAEVRQQLKKADFWSENYLYWLTHEESLEQPVSELWQETDMLCFPNSKAAQLFVQALDETAISVLQAKKIIVMGEKTQAVFEAYQVPVIQSEAASYESVIKQILKEAK